MRGTLNAERESRRTDRLAVRSWTAEMVSPEKEEGIMKTNRRAVMWAVILSCVWVLASWPQDTNSLPKRGEQIKIEGELTYIQSNGPAILEMKTAEGKEYRVQLPLGVIPEWRHEGFDPKVGEKVGVAGEVVCVLAGKPVISSSEIRLEGKTYGMIHGPS